MKCAAFIAQLPRGSPRNAAQFARHCVEENPIPPAGLRMNADTARRRWTYAVVAAFSAAALFGTPACGGDFEESEHVAPLFGPDPSRPQARGVILRFESWPPDAEEIEPLVRKLRNAGLRPGRALALFKSWVFAWDELRERRFAENMCYELALDDQVTSLFWSCTPDAVLEPSRSVDD